MKTVLLLETLSDAPEASVKDLHHATARTRPPQCCSHTAAAAAAYSPVPGHAPPAEVAVAAAAG